ncbi:MAG TPA: choice-of-anchor Q domain-containing protein [Kofleriaceae bacterium]|nr:choice-of-anchor Q domain-containing protein [Kofleriaceae bacterium]
MKNCLLLMAAALAAACSTTAAPGVCCIGPDDCGRLGLAEDRPCPAGQACVDLHCVVPSCSTQGCAADAPVCDVTTDVCTGCTSSSDCSRFSDTDLCEPQTGACVECLAQADCTSAIEPVCDGGSCRGCRLDTECPSGACGDDGACVAETAIVYLHPAGQDIAPCLRGAPCREPQFAIRQTTVARNHVVMAPGAYTTQRVHITPADTSAAAVFIHGHGARLSDTSFEGLFSILIPTTVRDLKVEYPSGQAFVATQAVLERVHIHALIGFRTEGPVVMRDVSIDVTGAGTAIDNAGALVLDRGVLTGGAFGIRSDGVVDITNLLVYGTSDTALELSSGRGSVSFTTVADSGSASSSAGGIRCPITPNTVTVRSSIFWTPGSRPAAGGACNFSSTIAGPVGAVGAMNLDPLFVDAAGRNYRLGLGSPARDMVDTGPAVDFEGDPRPQGARFDIGADEGL